MFQNTYEVGGKAYPITGAHTIRGVGTFPVVDIPLVSDYRWMLDCLESRMQHPEHYESREDMAATVERLKTYLEENRETGEVEGLYTVYLATIGGARA